MTSIRKKFQGTPRTTHHAVPVRCSRRPGEALADAGLAKLLRAGLTSDDLRIEDYAVNYRGS